MSDETRNQTDDRQQELLLPETETQTDTDTAPAEKNQESADQEQQEQPRLSFEEALQRLETIVTQLESSDITLDRSLELFQEGTRLSRLCGSILSAMEHKVTRLVETQDHQLQETPMPDEVDG